MKAYPVCKQCGGFIPPAGELFTISSHPVCSCIDGGVDSGQTVILTTAWSMRIISCGFTTIKPVKPPREPVPSLFQDAFKDGELEL